MSDVRCPFCGELIKEAAIKCPHCKTFLKEVPGRPTFLRDLKTEGHFLALGFWFRILSVLTVVAGAFVGIAVFVPGKAAGPLAGAMGMLIVVFCVGLGVLGFFIAQGLSRYRNWARITTGVLCILSVALSGISILMALIGAGRTTGAERAGNIFGQLINVALYLAMTITMMSARGQAICTDEYRRGMEQTPDQKASMLSSPFFWIYAVLIGLAFLAFAIAFLIGFSQAFR